MGTTAECQRTMASFMTSYPSQKFSGQQEAVIFVYDSCKQYHPQLSSSSNVLFMFNLLKSDMTEDNPVSVIRFTKKETSAKT